MSIVINFALFVLTMAFQIIFDVVSFAVLVDSSPRYLMKLPPAVNLTLFGCVFCGQKSTTILVYVTTQSFGMFLFWA